MKLLTNKQQKSFENAKNNYICEEKTVKEKRLKNKEKNKQKRLRNKKKNKATKNRVEKQIRSKIEIRNKSQSIFCFQKIL